MKDLLSSFTESKYRNLCAVCDSPAGCYNSDKYYGRQGALLCLTDNVGDIAWARLDDTLVHFKVTDANSALVKSSRNDGSSKQFT